MLISKSSGGWEGGCHKLCKWWKGRVVGMCTILDVGPNEYIY